MIIGYRIQLSCANNKLQKNFIRKKLLTKLKLTKTLKINNIHEFHYLNKNLIFLLIYSMHFRNLSSLIMTPLEFYAGMRNECMDFYN